MPYTVNDDPATVARIKRDLEIVAAKLRKEDPRLRSLILTGGFARGEGAVIEGRPQNDYDFVAVRRSGFTGPSYERLRRELEAELGIHVDLAPVSAWRLRHVRPTIFWYETALRGRTLLGPDLLDRIPIRDHRRLDPAEGLRLLVNRAAGLLLYSRDGTPHEKRLQAAKALLAASDAELLSSGRFAPSQTERQSLVRALARRGAAPPPIQSNLAWLEWAYRFKVDPAAADERDPHEAWDAARDAVLRAVPGALAHAGASSLESYARRDGLLDHLVFLRRGWRIPGKARLVLHPTGKVRVATLRLLAASPGGRLPPDALTNHLRAPGPGADPLRRLDELRRATLQ